MMCGLCGGTATGLASIDLGNGQVRFCHGDDDAEPTCYERATWSQTPLADWEKEILHDMEREKRDDT